MVKTCGLLRQTLNQWGNLLGRWMLRKFAGELELLVRKATSQMGAKGTDYLMIERKSLLYGANYIMESLILAQNERWRRVLSMQVER